MANSNIIWYLNVHREHCGLKKISNDVNLAIWFSYSSYAKMQLTAKSKSKFFSKFNQKFIDNSNFAISLHEMEPYVSRSGRPPAKKQRMKIGDLRSGLNLTDAINSNQRLFEDITPENIVLRTGTANLVHSGDTAITNTTTVSQSNSCIKKGNCLINWPKSLSQYLK